MGSGGNGGNYLRMLLTSRVIPSNWNGERITGWQFLSVLLLCAVIMAPGPSDWPRMLHMQCFRTYCMFNHQGFGVLSEDVGRK